MSLLDNPIHTKGSLKPPVGPLTSLLTPAHSPLDALPTHEAYSCLRTFAHSVPSAWNVLPHMTSCGRNKETVPHHLLLKYHLLIEAFPSPYLFAPPPPSSSPHLSPRLCHSNKLCNSLLKYFYLSLPTFHPPHTPLFVCLQSGR